MKKYLLSLAISFSLIATTAFGVDVSDVENLDPYFEKQGLQISNYNKVLVAPLGVGATFVVPPPWVTGIDANAKKWSLTEEDERWLRESYQKAVRAEIGEAFEVVDEPGEGVLIVRVELISLMPFARKGEDVQTQGFGVVVAQAQLRDGQNGELLAVYEGPQRVGRQYQQNTRLNSETSLMKLFEIWGERIRLYMESHVD
jgi:hypothetical protein